MSANLSETPPNFISVGENAESREIAVLLRTDMSAQARPALMWLGGYRSDMSGTKAVEMEALAAELGCASIRFDYSGHGASGGEFWLGTISRWLEEAMAVLDLAGPRRVVLVGSSMGGWVALRLIQELKRRGTGPEVTGLVLIAPAPDFTCDLIEPHLTAIEHASLEERGYFEEPSEYSSDPNIFTRALIEDGRQNRVLTGIIDTACPVHILQGMMDRDVPFGHALKLMEHLPVDDVTLTLIRDGDHRLSRPQDIERMRAAITALASA